MSYILDALKRAEAERGRTAVPGPQATPPVSPSPQPHQTGAIRPAVSRAPQRLWPAVAATLAVAGLAAGWWLWPVPQDGSRVAAVDAAVQAPLPPQPTPTPAPTPAPAPAPVPAQTPTPTPMPARPVPAPRVTQAPETSQPAAVVAPVSPPAPAPAPAPAAAVPPQPPKPAPAAKAADPASTPTPAPARQPTPALPMLAELPEALRREMPPLVITGSVYSSNPGQRLLLVNDGVLGQGSQAGPGLQLEEIRAKSSVFSFRGTRFRVAH